MVNADLFDLGVIFCLGGAFASLLMYFTSLQKGLLGLWNGSIFMIAAYFGGMAAFFLFVGAITNWAIKRGTHEEMG